MARILCVDDEPHVVTLKCAILEAAGHEATPSTSARDAIEKLKHNHYDAIVTDIKMPPVPIPTQVYCGEEQREGSMVQPAPLQPFSEQSEPQNRSPIYIWRSR